MGYELFGEKIIFPSAPVPDINNDQSLTLYELQLISLEKNYSLVTDWDYYLLDVILGGQLRLGYLIYDFWRGVLETRKPPKSAPRIYIVNVQSGTPETYLQETEKTRKSRISSKSGFAKSSSQRTF